MSTSMGVRGGGHPPHAVWVTRLTYADGGTEDVETVAGEDGCYTITVPEGVVSAGPSWRKGARLPAGRAHWTWTAGPGEYQAHPEAAPVTFVIPGVSRGGGGTGE